MDLANSNSNSNSDSNSNSSPTHKTTLLSIFFNKETKRPVFSFLLILPLSFVLLQQLAPSQPLSFFLLAFSPNENGNGNGNQNGNGNGARCDYTTGKWVWNEGVSYYTEECPFLDPGFQCVRNGRNDTGYMHWRWQPHGCDLPMFNASDMLERSRNGRIVFAGDSIGRNQWESLVCMLAKGVDNRSRIYEQFGNPITKHRGFLSLVFQDYNLTVEYYRAPMLVTVDRLPPNASAGGPIKGAVRVDMLPRLARRWVGADVLLFNTGHWWSEDKIAKMGNYIQVGKTINMTMDIKEAFKSSLETVTNWTVNNPQLSKTTHIFFRSFSPSHYTNGTWDTNGTCTPETDPWISTSGFEFEPEPWSNAIIARAVEEMKRGGRNAWYLDITHPTELRKDGHPSSHREPGTPPHVAEDCSHWCLPGVPDMWNEILYAGLLSVNYNTKNSNNT